jgi:hypothetical protein
LVKGYPMSSISIPKGKTRGSYTALNTFIVNTNT